VLSEQNMLRAVANGKNVPLLQRPILTATPPAPKPDAAVETTTKTEPARAAPEQVAMLR